MEKNEKTGEVNNIFIRGIFAQSELQNKNGRSYPDHILEREAYRLPTMIPENKLTGDETIKDAVDHKKLTKAIDHTFGFLFF